jgi:L-fuculose-phosphate aldolase
MDSEATMNYSLMHPREQLVTIMQRIYGYGMTTTSGGNISILDDDGDIWITPAGIDKGSLREEDIIRMRGGYVMEGSHRPSSEYPFHRTIYQKRPDIRAVLHAHPSALVAFSAVKKIPDTAIIPQAKRVCGTVGYAEYAIPGSQELGDKIAARFAQGFEIVLLENHGVVAAGTNLLEAFQRFETLDFCARTLINAAGLGPAHTLSEDQLKQSDLGKNMMLEEFEPASHPSSEREMRRMICGYVHRAYKQRLMTSTEGVLSVRLDADSFLITPSGVDRNYLDESDLVLISKGRREKGKAPSRSVVLHREIYAENPKVNAIASAQCPAATAFSVAGVDLDTRIIPESYIVLRRPPLIPYGKQFTGEKDIARIIGESSPVALLENDAILTTGSSLAEAFDRMEVTEFSARALLNAGILGKPDPVGDQDILAIEEKFGLK